MFFSALGCFRISTVRFIADFVYTLRLLRVSSKKQMFTQNKTHFPLNFERNVGREIFLLLARCSLIAREI